MAELREERRLAAILAADMVGYSRLVGNDERGTIARQKAHRTGLIDPKIAEHHGRIVKTTGDGFLAEFASVVDAIECAIAIQQAMADREAGEPEERRIQYRMGINLGDIVIDGEDILGDGVNVAARLEGLAEPNGICLSRAARDQVRDKLDLALEDLGEIEVKNIARPVRVFRVLTDERGIATRRKKAARPASWRLAALAAVLVVGAAGAVAIWLKPWAPAEQPAPVGQATLPLPDKPSIAILPFDNLSGESEQEYFADGITEDITTELSRFRDLFVIARTSAFVYKGKAVNVREVGRELGVRYVLEGSVRRSGTTVRINAQLVDVSRRARTSGPSATTGRTCVTCSPCMTR